MNDFISKPVDSSKLGRMLLAWLPRRTHGDVLSGITNHPAPSPANAPELENLDILDVAPTLARLNGDQALYGKVLRMFRDGSAASFRARYDAALEKQDWSDIALLAHTLKGGCRNLGISRLGNLAEQQEDHARTGRHDVLQDQLPDLYSELDRTLSQLARLDQSSPPENTEQSGGRDDLSAALARLRQGLEQRDAQARALLAEIAPDLKRLAPSGQVEELMRAVSRYDYATALERLAELPGMPAEESAKEQLEVLP